MPLAPLLCTGYCTPAPTPSPDRGVIALLHDMLVWAAAGAGVLLVWSLLAFCVGVTVGRVIRNRDDRG